jgi:hypothetical protein
MRPSLFLLGCLALASLCALTLGCPAPAQNPNGSYKESGAAHVYSPEENRIRAKVGEVSHVEIDTVEERGGLAADGPAFLGSSRIIWSWEENNAVVLPRPSRRGETAICVERSS